MALHLPLHFPITSLPHPKFRKLNKLTPILLKPITFPNQTPLKFTARATSSEEEEDKPIKTDEKTDEISDIGSEIRKAMKEREEREEEREVGFWYGVAKEVKEIEWPAFGKVVGTTGVVLGVIAGSSVVLLTVNAVFAELSDRVFAGRGVQDFFG